MLHIESAPTTIDGIARRAGMSRSSGATLEAIEKRRSQLRGLMFVLVGALGTSVVALTGTTADVGVGVEFAGLPAARLGVLALLFGFGGYVLEKERNLRALSEMLIEQQVADRAKQEIMNRLIAADQFKSDFVANIDARLNSAFESIDSSLQLIEPDSSPQNVWPALSEAARRDTNAARQLLREMVSEHDQKLVELARGEATAAQP